MLCEAAWIVVRYPSPLRQFLAANGPKSGGLCDSLA
jgi:hypothetical protein